MQRAIAGGHTELNTDRNPEFLLRNAGLARVATLLAIAAFAVLSPARVLAEKASPSAPDAAQATPQEAARCAVPDHFPHAAACQSRRPLIVIGFMGGRVHANNFSHGEARLARNLDQRYPDTVHAVTFANHDQHRALRTLLQLLGSAKDGRVSVSEKNAARIILFGHSWGASEAIQFARELDQRGIPVLLTVQVDSVEKSGEDDGAIPPNVREAINFYQTEGLLHGRTSIQAIDPKRTTILGSYESSYRVNHVSCAGYSWYARAFMHSHIEIENDDAVWGKIETLIVARSCATNPDGAVTACAAE
jgi:hypothetical protein